MWYDLESFVSDILFEADQKNSWEQVCQPEDSFMIFKSEKNKRKGEKGIFNFISDWNKRFI